MYKMTKDDNLNYYTNSDRFLIDYIKKSVYSAKKIDIMVAFIKTSGINVLQKEFEYIRDNKIPLRILTGTYLGITDPAALYKLKDILRGHGEIRFYSEKKRSFHPKAYFFETEVDDYLYLGSSNLSWTALKRGVEWNYRIIMSRDKESYNGYRADFERIFEKESHIVTDEELEKYRIGHRKPKILPLEAREEDKEYRNELKAVAESLEDYKVRPFINANDAQIEALYELKRTRESGADKSLVVAATGVGKTYLAAFDSLNFDRVLFVAHREEILEQARDTFKAVRGDVGLGMYNSKEKSLDSNILIASIQTLSKDHHLNKFSSDHFDYIIVDEFHHSSARTYQKLLDHFKPKFLLGLTATPHRTDNKDIYEYCDHNVSYEVDLFSAINKGWLSTFHYYGIYDVTVDYDNITFIKGKYDEKKLAKSLSVENRYKLILKHYNRFKSKRAIGFCSNIKHADNMAKAFNAEGIPAMAVHNESNNRNEAVELLKEGKIKIIFAVDIFNEGVDIKALDMVLFLRPTESSIVFLQQLGRGLRLDKDKSHLVVLDFIGNYKKVNLVPLLLTGRNHIKGDTKIDINKITDESFFPEGCRINFDMNIIDLFEKYNRETRKLGALIAEEYHRVKEYVGQIPSRSDLFRYFDDDIYTLMKKKSKQNLFIDYIGHLKKLEPEYASTIEDTFGHEFIKMVETTKLSKLYKIPVLLAFYNDGNILMSVNEEEVLKRFKAFYENGQNYLDMLRHDGTKDYRTWNDKKIVDLAYKWPIKMLAKTENELFELEGREFRLNDDLKKFIGNDEFIEHFKDAIEFKRNEFFKKRLTEKEKKNEELIK